MLFTRLVTGFAALLLAGCTSSGVFGPAKVSESGPVLELIGYAELPTGTLFHGTEVGGLSGLTFDSKGQVYYAISDDRSEHAPARFYTLALDLTAESFDEGNLRILAVTTLQQNGEPFAEDTLDPEGIAWVPGQGIFISSEGNARKAIAPFVRRFDRTGEQIAELPVPEKFLPDGNRTYGVRNNLGFEGLSFDPETRLLWVATENALAQEDAKADLDRPSSVRLLAYDLAAGGTPREVHYRVDPVAEEPSPFDDYRTAGLVELMASGDGRFLFLERSYSAGAGTTVRLYQASLDQAPDISSLPMAEAGSPVEKSLVADLDTFGVPMDNLEGMALGPRLGDGRRFLVVVSDNNFLPEQRNLIMVFALRWPVEGAR
ncbi:MAG: esterase-like activity of phytase family protein [Acidobacteriota bacterium]